MLYENVCIESVAHVLPPHVVTSADLEIRLAPTLKRLGFPQGTLAKLTGVRERRFFDRGVRVAQPAALAGERALLQAGIEPHEVQMCVNGSVTRDYLEPAVATLVAGRLGFGRQCLSYDITNACVGFMTSLVAVANMIELGVIDTGIVVASEVVRDAIDATIERLLAPTVTHDEFRGNFATLTLGSSAAAVVLRHRSKSRSGHRLKGAVWRGAPEHNDLCVATHTQMRANNHGLLTHGLKLATETWPLAAAEFGWDADGPDEIIFHQVGLTHFEHTFKALNLSLDKALVTFPYLGNTAPVSVPVTLSVGVAQGRITPGTEIALFGMGSGLGVTILGVEW
ncbi:MAG: 3-oxoacyl-[acyl-carrier-protein] synthase III [Kiritimatiellia bacterium]|jgi:3-oxoacyl-[acyl-carrier-protein] synthase III